MNLRSLFANMVLVAASLSLLVKIVKSSAQDEEDEEDDREYERDVHPQSRPRAGKMNACLQNCANCVQFWEHGLYNGRRCAKRCLHRRGRVVVDPDCNDPKMFNYSPRIISDLLIEMRENQADQPAAMSSGSDEEDEVDDGDRSTQAAGRNRAERSGGDEIDRRQDVEAKHQRRSKKTSQAHSSSSPAIESYVLRRNGHKKQPRKPSQGFQS